MLRLEWSPEILALRWGTQESLTRMATEPLNIQQRIEPWFHPARATAFFGAKRRFSQPPSSRSMALVALTQGAQGSPRGRGEKISHRGTEAQRPRSALATSSRGATDWI